MKFLKLIACALLTLTAPAHAKRHKKNLTQTATETKAKAAAPKHHHHEHKHPHQHPLCRQDSQFSNLYYHNNTTFHEIREPKKRCFFTFNLNTLFNISYLNLKTMTSIIKKRSLATTSKTLFTCAKLSYEKRLLKKDITQPEGFVWDALLDKYENNTPEQRSMIDDIRLLTTHITSVNTSMADLLYNMHTVDHEQTILSDIGKPSIDICLAHLKETPDNLPEENVFTHLQKVISSKSSSIPSRKNNWISTANGQVYKKLLDNNKTKKIKIYIDQNRKNVLSALQAGFDIGIVFKNTTNLLTILTALTMPIAKQEIREIQK